MSLWSKAKSLLKSARDKFIPKPPTQASKPLVTAHATREEFNPDLRTVLVDRVPREMQKPPFSFDRESYGRFVTKNRQALVNAMRGLMHKGVPTMVETPAQRRLRKAAFKARPKNPPGFRHTTPKVGPNLRLETKDGEKLRVKTHMPDLLERRAAMGTGRLSPPVPRCKVQMERLGQTLLDTKRREREEAKRD
jgi:hypothetical protein